MSESLTERQRETLDILIEAALCGEPCPTLREIGDEMGIRSTNGVNDHLKALEREGYVYRDELKARSITVVGLWPPAPTAEAWEPARIFTFSNADKARDWSATIGLPHEFILYGVHVVVTRPK